MQKEIGSNFNCTYLEECKHGQPSTITQSKKLNFFLCARNAIRYILENIEAEKKVMLPAYTCESVIKPFLEEAFDICFYSLNKDLSVNEEELIDKYNTFKPSFFLIHDYFGFPCFSKISGIIEVMKGQGTIILNDLTQSMFSAYKKIDADFYFGSIRKWCEVLDGAFLYTEKMDLSTCLLDEHLSYIENMEKANVLKSQFLDKGVGDKEEYLKLFHDAEERLDNLSQVYAMSNVSKNIMDKIQVDKMVNKRRQNFIYLLNDLTRNDLIQPVFQTIDQETVPLYFPVYCVERNKVKEKLCRNQIYAPVIWPRSSYLTELSQECVYIYEHILAIPCDQRYDLDDMQRICTVLNKC